MDRDSGLWSRYWIISGIGVVHRNDVTDLNMDRLHLFKMTVDRVVKRSKGEGDSRKTYVDGVRCHWLDNSRKYQTGTFHTNELVPYEVAERGIEEVNRWISRDNG